MLSEVDFALSLKKSSRESEIGGAHGWIKNKASRFVLLCRSNGKNSMAVIDDQNEVKQ